MMGQGATVRVRRMEQADLGAVMEIAESLPEAPHWPAAAYLAALDPIGMPQRVSLVVVMPEDGKVAGFAVASLLGPQAELEMIAVAGAAQRQGVAGRLFVALAEELRVAEMTEVILEVRVSNHPALRLYRRLGFTETGRRRGYYVDPIEDAVLMRRTIGI